MTVARTLEAVLGPDLPIGVRPYDGSRLGPADALATLLIRSPNGFSRLVTAPGEQRERGFFAEPSQVISQPGLQQRKATQNDSHGPVWPSAIERISYPTHDPPACASACWATQGSR
jgi:hypothetical protein